MSVPVSTRVRQWRAAWVGLAIALALHVTDEALTGFLPMFNGIVQGVRARHSWVPFPTFTFPVWLGGLILFVVLLLALTPFVSRGKRWIRIVSFVLALQYLLNLPRSQFDYRPVGQLIGFLG